MAYVDAQLLFSDAQALSATGASTNVVDLSVPRTLGAGRGMTCYITNDVALAGTSPTLQVTLQTATDSAFTSPVTVGQTTSQTSMPAGTRLEIPLVSNVALQRYIRLNYTLGGTTPTVTVTAYLSPAGFADNQRYYADASPIS